MTTVSGIDSQEVNIYHIAEYMFCKNVEDKRFGMSLEGITTTKDLFCFCVDLLIHGLAMLYGTYDDNSNVRRLIIDIETISLNDFATIKKKMKAGGIDVSLKVEDNIDKLPYGDNMHQILMTMPDNCPLESFEFKVVTNNNIYKITFALIQSNDDQSCHYNYNIRGSM